MVIRRLNTAYSLLKFLEQDTDLTVQLRSLFLLMEDGRSPSRRTWERRLQALPDCLGRHVAGLIQPWLEAGRAAVLDSTPLRAKGGVWHKKDREKGVVPHSTIDTTAQWSKSGYHGWWYGFKLHLAADLTPAHVYDAELAPALVGNCPLRLPMCSVRRTITTQFFKPPIA